MGAQSWKKRCAAGVSRVTSLIIRTFCYFLGGEKEGLDWPATGSTFPSPSGKPWDDRSGSSHGSSGSVRSQRTLTSHDSQQDPSDHEADCDMPLGFGQKKQCPEGATGPSLQPGPAMTPLENSSATGSAKTKLLDSGDEPSLSACCCGDRPLNPSNCMDKPFMALLERDMYHAPDLNQEINFWLGRCKSGVLGRYEGRLHIGRCAVKINKLYRLLVFEVGKRLSELRVVTLPEGDH